MFAITAQEVIAGKAENEDAQTLTEIVSKLPGDRLRVCSLQFDKVLGRLDKLSANVPKEANFQLVLVDEAFCQVSVLLSAEMADFTNVLKPSGGGTVAALFRLF